VPEPGGDLDLAQESLPAQRSCEVGPNDFHCDVPRVLDISRQIDSCHTAATNFAFDLIAAAESLRNRGVTILDQQTRKSLGARTIEHRYRAFALVYEPLEFGAEAWVVRAQLCEYGRPLLMRRVEHSIDERRELLPSIRQ